MVKALDDIEKPELLDHIGWRLWQASERWQEEFDREMVRAGYAWFAEARANVIAYLDRDGTRQSDLVARMRLSKQAVQQFVDDLEHDGILKRIADPQDARGKIVVLTKQGLSVLASANKVKRAIEKDYEKRLGIERFKQLGIALRLLAEKE